MRLGRIAEMNYFRKVVYVCILALMFLSCNSQNTYPDKISFTAHQNRLTDSLQLFVSLLKPVQIDSVKDRPTVNIYLLEDDYEFSWDFLLSIYCGNFFSEQDILAQDLGSKDDTIYLDVHYNFDEDNIAGHAIRLKKGLNYAYREGVLLRKFTKYLLSELSPNDFKIIDSAMVALYRETGHSVFDVSWLTFLFNMSSHHYLSAEEQKVFDALVDYFRRNNRSELSTKLKGLESFIVPDEPLQLD